MAHAKIAVLGVDINSENNTLFAPDEQFSCR
jgi:hypothetical protein